jgi:hypothetical protein
MISKKNYKFKDISFQYILSLFLHLNFNKLIKNLNKGDIDLKLFFYPI